MNADFPSQISFRGPVIETVCPPIFFLTKCSSKLLFPILCAMLGNVGKYLSKSFFFRIYLAVYLNSLSLSDPY